MPLAALLKGECVEKGAKGCTDKGYTEVGSYHSSIKEGRKVDRGLETPLGEGGASGHSQRRGIRFCSVDRGVRTMLFLFAWS